MPHTQRETKERQRRHQQDNPPRTSTESPCCWCRHSSTNELTSWAKFFAISVPTKVDLPTPSARFKQIPAAPTTCEHPRIEIDREHEMAAEDVNEFAGVLGNHQTEERCLQLRNTHTHARARAWHVRFERWKNQTCALLAAAYLAIYAAEREHNANGKRDQLEARKGCFQEARWCGDVGCSRPSLRSCCLYFRGKRVAVESKHASD